MDTRDGRIYGSLDDVPESARPFIVEMERPLTPRQLRTMRVGRNDYCPCGSRLKFKRCCMMRIQRGETTLQQIEAENENY